jgi:hypothetical protein
LFAELSGDTVDEDPMALLLGYLITCRLGVGPQAGHKVFTLQTLSACDPKDQLVGTVRKVAGFSLHVGVSARLMNARGLCGCAATSVVRRYRKSGSRTPQAVRVDTR